MTSLRETCERFKELRELKAAGWRLYSDPGMPPYCGFVHIRDKPRVWKEMLCERCGVIARYDWEDGESRGDFFHRHKDCKPGRDA